MTFKLKISTFLLSLSLLGGIKPSQLLAQNIIFNHLQSENGLSANAVISISQDEKGLMWFGTPRGLNCFDGVRNRIYNKMNPVYNSLYSSYINALLTDSQNRLWVGTGYGLNVYDSQNDVFLRVRLNAEDKALVKTLYEDKSGIIWIGTATGLFAFRNNDTSVVVRMKDSSGANLAAGTINSICEDFQGNIWIGSTEHLVKMWRKNGKFYYKKFLHNPLEANSLSSNAVTQVYEDGNKNLWVATSNSGLNLYNRRDGTFRHFSKENTQLIHNNIRSIIFRNKQELWLGTQEGLSVLNTQTYAITSYQNENEDNGTLSHNSIFSLYKDKNQSIWIGTFFGGVNRVDSLKTDFHSIRKNKLPNNVVSSMLEDKEHNIWMSTEGGGLVYFNRSKNDFTVYKHDPDNKNSIASNQVKVLFRDSDDNFWVGTHTGGLNLFDPHTGTFTRYLQPDSTRRTVSILGIEEDKQHFWVTTNRGVRQFKRNGTSLQELPIQTTIPEFRHLLATVPYVDTKDNLWLGGVDGLFRLTGNKVDTFFMPNIVNTIFEDKQGRIWVGFQEKGLSVYMPEADSIKWFPDLTNDMTDVFAILQDDDGHLWISSSNGIIRFTPSDQTIKSYVQTDGIVNREFMFNSRLKDHKGQMFFGGLRGITWFNPTSISVNEHEAPLIFTGLQLKNREVSQHSADGLLKTNITNTNKLVFKYNQDVFTISFALLNFIKSDKNRYAYKLEGFDSDWKYTRNTSVTYSNLKDGSYQLIVKGANNDGIWTKPIVMDITVQPPLWRSWWAYLLYLLLAATIFIFTTRFLFMRALLQKEGELHQHKLNVFSNVSHEVRTHLSLIVPPVEKLQHSAGIADSDREQLAKIKKNADRLLTLVNELLDFRKADANKQTLVVVKQDLIPFLKEILSNYDDLSVSKSIVTSLRNAASEAILYYDAKQLEKVFFNLLSNAMKFTPEGGRISISVQENEKSIHVEVADTGKGIPNEYLPNLFTNFYQVADYGEKNIGYGLGLALSKKIVNLHHGNIWVESCMATESKNGYTKFHLRFLKGSTHFLNDSNVTILEKAINTTVPDSLPQELAVAELPTVNGSVQNYTILVVEDNPELRELLTQNLSEHYKVLEAPDGKTGYEMARETVPDLVISDVMMPDMNGYELTYHIKNDDTTNHIPVILLTAKTTEAEQMEGLQQGADLYLTKPFSINLLLLNIRNLLTTKRLLRQRVLREVTRLHVGTEVENNAPLSQDNFLNDVIAIIDKKMDNADFGVERLSRDVGMSPPVLYKKIRATTNLSVNELIKVRRFRKAASLIIEGKLKINEIAYAVGFDDRKYFSKEFKKYFGVAPSEFTEASNTNMEWAAFSNKEE